MQRGFPCSVNSTKLPFSQLLLRLLARLSSSQPWASLPLKQRGEGGGDCVSAPVLFMVQRQRSQPSPALSSLTHSFINETDESAKSRHWIRRWQRTQSGVHACAYRHRHKPADSCTMLTAAGAKHKYSLSKHPQMFPCAGILQSIQSVSVVISITYSMLLLRLAEVRSSLCLNTAEADFCTKEHLWGLWGQVSFLSQSKTDWGINRSKGLSKVIQEDCSRCKIWPPANSRHYSCSHSRESCTVGHVLNCLSFQLKCTTLKNNG